MVNGVVFQMLHVITKPTELDGLLSEMKTMVKVRLANMPLLNHVILVAVLLSWNHLLVSMKLTWKNKAFCHSRLPIQPIMTRWAFASSTLLSFLRMNNRLIKHSIFIFCFRLHQPTKFHFSVWLVSHQANQLNVKSSTLMAQLTNSNSTTHSTSNKSHGSRLEAPSIAWSKLPLANKFAKSPFHTEKISYRTTSLLIPMEKKHWTI